MTDIPGAVRVPSTSSDPLAKEKSTSSSQFPAIAKGDSCEIVYKNLTFEAKNPDGGWRPILKGLSGIFRPGRLHAIMGPSGAGKTSLLNIVAGLISVKHHDGGGTTRLTGQVLVNSEHVVGERMRRISCFVQQEDVVMQTMTVKEAITLSAFLRLPKTLSKAEKMMRVEETIEALGLRKSENTLIGGAATKKGISGGEKKRVCLAMEMVLNPRILFLDEPTSGLDTSTAYDVLKILSGLAAAGRTIVCTLHQPSSEIFHLFDDLTVLSHGSIVFTGESNKLVPYAKSIGHECPLYTNPADFVFMEVLGDIEQLQAGDSDFGGRLKRDTIANRARAREETAQRVALLPPKWDASPEAAATTALLEGAAKGGVPAGLAGKQTRVGLCGEFLMLSKRAGRNVWRNPMMFKGRIAQTIIMSVMVGLIYLDLGTNQKSIQDRNGCLFFVTSNVLMTSMMNVISIFGLEKQVFVREHKSQMYSLLSYYFSKVFVEAPMQILIPIISALIVYFMVGFQADVYKFIAMCLVILVQNNAGFAFGMCISTAFSDVQVAMAVAPMIFLPLMFFSGYLINIKDIPPWFVWIPYISPMKYGFAANAQIEYGNLKLMCEKTEFQKLPNGQYTDVCPYTTGEEVLSLLGMTEAEQGNWAENLGYLVVMYCAFTCLALFLLWRSVADESLLSCCKRGSKGAAREQGKGEGKNVGEAVELQQLKPEKSSSAVPDPVTDDEKEVAVDVGEVGHGAFQAEANGSGDGMDVVFQNVRFGVKKNKSSDYKPILYGCSGVFRRGRLTAIMGASGAGKTSLLDLIAGHIPRAAEAEATPADLLAGKKGTAASGRVLLEGHGAVNGREMKRLSAYLQQEDVLLATMTVKECLRMSALLRLPKDMKRADKYAQADNIISLLHLENCQNTLIGSPTQKGVSGGERKRVCLGAELLTNPSVLFLDEPTSGLDSLTAFGVVAVLKQLAASGKTVVCTIHQPSSEIFRLFDDLTLVAAGKVVYSGTTEAVVPYFDKHQYSCPAYCNPADYIFMSILQPTGLMKNQGSEQAEQAKKQSSLSELEIADRLANMWVQSEAGIQQALELEKQGGGKEKYGKGEWRKRARKSTGAGLCMQFGVLLRRALKNMVRNKLLLRVRVAQSVFMGLLLGLIYFDQDTDQLSVQNRQGLLFIMCANSFMATAMGSLSLFGQEKVVFSREYASHMYSLPAYFFSKLLVEFPLYCVTALVQATITYWLVGLQPIVSNFFTVVLAMVFLANVGVSVGTMLACAFPDVSVALAVSNLILMPLMFFSGLFINMDSIQVFFRWIPYISPIKYAFLSVAKTELTNLEFYCKKEQYIPTPSGGTICPIQNGDQVLELLSFTDEEEGTVAFNLVVLGCLYFMFIGLALFALFWSSGGLKRCLNKT